MLIEANVSEEINIRADVGPEGRCLGTWNVEPFMP